ncbi:MAG TPA: glycosyltransferase [Gemmatimonadales bacterium]
MRILFLSHAYPRHDGDIAGGFIHLLAAGVQRRGHEVSVLAPSDGGAGGSEVLDGVHITRVRYAPAARETLAYRGTMAESLRSIAGVATVSAFVASHAWEVWGRPVQLVHAHWWVPGGVSAGLAKLAGGPPYVLTLHGTDVALLKRSRAAREVARWVLRGASAVTTASSYLADKAARVAGLDPASIVVRPMPTNVGGAALDSHGGGGVVTVGRLTAQKRIGMLIEAMAILRDRGVNAPLTIVGDGPERDALERRVADRNLADRVRFTGAVPPSQIPATIGNADVFAFPAVDEGLGLAAAEALMLGVPVVACRSGGVPDIVPDGGAGRLVPPGHLDAFAAALQELLTDTHARDRARDVGRILRIQLSPDAVAEVFEGVYQRALGVVRHA